MRNGAKTMLTVNEAADLVGLSRIFVLQQIEAGKLSSIKVAADEPRVTRMDLIAWHSRFREQQGAALAELGVELDHELNSSGIPTAGQAPGPLKKGKD
jgi:excisionase family DNA binding protein